ncbi:MAG TPA: RlmE family RNA methyltransferase [Anaerolineae bacterium]|nr:RlmE family RNA methyltransferase [Anaerolineae bacterium]HQI84502.1 RlmE family RNA methyltransferase [Anaerolineae bacterium]
MSHWRKQQSKELYFQKAKQEGYRARSAYKLLQIQEKFHVIRRSDVVVDLGAAPGSWCQVTVKLVGDRGRVIALDLQEIEPLPGVITLQGDMTDPAIQAQVIELAGGRANVVLSDAAPSTTGIKLRDHVLSIELGYTALAVAKQLLIPGGNLVIKVFEGEDLPGLIRAVKIAFHPVKVHTPAATRNESWESFIVAQGFKGRQ